MNHIIDNFFERFKTTRIRLLLLDYDGTLAPFRPERDKAIPYNGVEKRLDILISSSSTKVIIISGRALKDLKPLLNLKKLPEIWGSHGWEKLSAEGQYIIRKAGGAAVEDLELARKYLHAYDLDKFMEEKPASIAVHFRGVEENKVVEIRKTVLHNWNELAANGRLIYSEFDGGLELKIPGFNKGDVIKDIISDYTGGVIAAYLGDDKTDEDAFKALPDWALGILVKKESLATAAAAGICPPEELLEFLDRWIKLDEPI